MGADLELSQASRINEKEVLDVAQGDTTENADSSIHSKKAAASRQQEVWSFFWHMAGCHSPKKLVAGVGIQFRSFPRAIYHENMERQTAGGKR
jgi:hypothetical protein